MRLKTLKRLDQLLQWSTPPASRTYALFSSVAAEVVTPMAPELETFAERYGFFSATRPLLGTVTGESKDLGLVLCVLEKLVGTSEFVVAEFLAKVVAYREMAVGQRLLVPVDASLELFVVDRVFDLWLGMPAYGLRPEREGVPALLLFRGTDLSLDSPRGWASIMSDLDISGPGLSAFTRAQEELHHWLTAMQSQGHAARVLGFSLGGALAAYTFVYENALLDGVGSMSFNAPGVSKKVVADWQALPESRQKGWTAYVAKGDLISKVGQLCGVVFELSTGSALMPLTAHAMLMGGQVSFFKHKVNVVVENGER